jgi:predicted RNA binding protein YcfA (HicA-like mRNA interferase family)
LPKLPRVSGDEVIRGLERLGFVQVRQRGSHIVMKRTDSAGTRGCVVPRHPEVAAGTLRGILKQAGVSLEALLEKL